MVAGILERRQFRIAARDNRRTFVPFNYGIVLYPAGPIHDWDPSSMCHHIHVCRITGFSISVTGVIP